jgi:hypothetical protein
MSANATQGTVESAAAQSIGGWSGFNFNLTPDAKKVFDKAVTLVGVRYTPLAFAHQMVKETSLCYLVKGAIVVPGNPEFAALIYVYQPPQGEPHITAINRINPGQLNL